MARVATKKLNLMLVRTLGGFGGFDGDFVEAAFGIPTAPPASIYHNADFTWRNDPSGIARTNRKNKYGLPYKDYSLVYKSNYNF